MTRRELQFDDGKSRKFWTIALKATEHTVTFGRIGTKGQTRTRNFATKDAAKKSYDVLVKQKLAKGYVDAKSPASEPVDAWEHPQLGRFKFDDIGWITTCSLPAFGAFKYRQFGGRGRGSKIEFRFETEDVQQLPSKQALAVALGVVKNQERLAERVKKAMWDDLNGKGEDSGMWWHGDRDTIEDAIAFAFACRDRRPKPFRKPDDLLQLMGEVSVSIQERVPYYERPCATINFEAAFEVEHGVGVLTDGSRILGTGYAIDAAPFFKEQVVKKKR